MSNPYALLGELRRAGPVCPVQTHQGLPSWLVLGYESVLAAVVNPALRNDSRHAGDLLARSAGYGDPFDVFKNEHMLSRDPPEHIRLRRVVSRVLTSRNVVALRPRIVEIVDGLIDNFVSAGHVDLVQDFARPIPVAVISELLGISEVDRYRVERLSARVVQPLTRDSVPDVREARGALWQFMDLLAAERWRSPSEDIVSLLLAAERQGRMSRAEVIATAVLVLVAGHETTVSLIAGTVFELLSHGVARDAMADHRVLLGSIEETLRYNGPVMHNVRYSAEDTEVLGVPIPRGSEVVLCTAAANHDPERFAWPHVFDVKRTAGGPHLGFGYGIHYCVGAALARLETEVAVGAVLRRLPDLALAVPASTLRWRKSFLRGLSTLPLTFRPCPRPV